ncbi:MAG TPA: MarR family transcriptional regulator [Alphaproteobacteria bacterium]
MTQNDPERMFGFVLHDVARLLRRRFEQYLRADAIGLTRTQCAVLAHLARQEGINQATLAQLLDVEPITLVHLLDRLQDAGFIQRKPDPKDRRAYALELTPKARPVLTRIYELADSIYDEAQVGLTAAERTQFLSQLQRVKSNLLRRTLEGDVGELAPTRRKRRA